MSLFLTPKKHSRERVYEMECPTGSPTGVSAIDDLEGDCPSGLSDSMNTISSINSLSISFSPIRLFRTPTVAVGSHWSIEVHILKNSSAADEVLSALSRIEELLYGVDNKDKLSFYLRDFDDVIHVLKKKPFWNDEIRLEISRIRSHQFSRSLFRKVPFEMMNEILKWLQVRDFYAISCVSREWNAISCGNHVWNEIYHNRFPVVKDEIFHPQIMVTFKERMESPLIGDHVEIMWSGKFRLAESVEYHGVSWWPAVVVGKDTELERFRVHYAGWESRWDEWVPRERLRWVCQTDSNEEIKTHDLVELWCHGSNVPGAWLSCRVQKIKKGNYCLGNVFQSGRLWVPRDRIRPCRKKFHRPHHSSGLSFMPHVGSESGSCSLM